MKYYSAKTVTQLLGVTAQTLRNWDGLVIDRDYNSAINLANYIK